MAGVNTKHDVESQLEGADKSAGWGFGIFNWLLFVVLAVLLFFISHYGIMFLVLGMSPAFIAKMADRRIGKCASRSISVFNFMGIAPYLFEMFLSGDRVLAAKRIATDYSTWLFVYGMAILGWFIVWLIPQIASAVFTTRAVKRIKELEEKQHTLLREWGTEVADGVQDYTKRGDEESS